MKGGRGAISLYYFAYMAGVGAFYPYFALYLTSVGLHAATATRVAGIVSFVGLLTPPLMGLLADARSARVWILRVLTLAAAISFMGYLLVAGNVFGVVAVTVVFGVLRSPLGSLLDATNFEHVRQHGGHYGAQRVWGTAGYMLAVLACGWLIDATSVVSVVWVNTAMLLLASVCAWRMPAPPVARQAAVLDAYRRMLRQPSLWLFLLTIVPTQMASVIYDTSFALYLTRLGWSGTFIGVAIAIGVAAEIILMARSSGILARLSADRALAIALAVAALRWFAMAHVHEPVVILLMQPVHAITFGLFWVSATALARDYAGPEAVAAGQGMLATTMGVGSMLGTSFAGAVLEQRGGSAMWTVAAALAGTAAVIALVHVRVRATLPAA
jgi:PPP family 3-phenylpropionic acid transporter